MKAYLKIVAVAFALVLGFNTNAQTVKLGHINGSELVQAMPESDSAQVTLERLQKTYADQIEMLQVEFQNKLQDYQANAATMTDLIRQSKEKELGDIQQRVQEFQQTAQKDLQQKNAELFQPIMKKAEEAINKVAKENGFTYIFDLGQGGILYHSEQSIDILPLVKKELGI